MARKENPYRIRYGTGDGEIKFGHLTEDNEQSAVMIRNYKELEGKHYITLDQTGAKFRKNSTTCRSTGAFQVKAGDASEKDELITEGYNEETGNITLQANEKVILQGQAVNVKANNSVSIISDKTIDCIARNNYNIYASIIDIVDSVQTSQMLDPGSAINSFLGGNITAHELRMAFRTWISGGGT